MIRQQQPALSRLAIGLIGMGTLCVLYRDFAFGWQPVPQFHPGREALAVVLYARNVGYGRVLFGLYFAGVPPACAGHK